MATSGAASMTAAVTTPTHALRGVDIPSLDGVRAVAVALVFLAHSGLEKIVPGGLGVTIFFVLSGYLISTLMRIEFANEGRIDFRAFYLRRFFRLMPPLAVIVGIVLILTWFSVVSPFSRNGLLAVLFYFGNYFVIANDFHGLPAGLGVVWSLAVEEHYYLFYPPLAALLLRVGRVGISAGALLALCAIVLGWRCYLALHGVSEDYITMATDTRIDAILIGCLLALRCNPWLDPALARNKLRDAAFISASVAVLLFTLVYRDEFFRMTFRYALQSVAVAVLLYFAVARPRSLAFRWLNHRALVYVGAISYTVYLSHHLIMEWLNAMFPGLNWAVFTICAIVLTLAVAEPMRRWVEMPCARLRRRLHRNSLSKKKTITISSAMSGSTP